MSEWWKAVFEKMRNEPIEVTPPMEYFQCRDKGCLTSGEKLLHLKIKCPVCGGPVWDFDSLVTEDRKGE